MVFVDEENTFFNCSTLFKISIQESVFIFTIFTFLFMSLLPLSFSEELFQEFQQYFQPNLKKHIYFHQDKVFLQTLVLLFIVRKEKRERGKREEKKRKEIEEREREKKRKREKRERERTNWTRRRPRD